MRLSSFKKVYPFYASREQNCWSGVARHQNVACHFRTQDDRICKVTRASKLFQRNYYLPLMRPLSPKDAYRRHVLTGTNLLGKKMDHYIPVLEEVKERQQRKKTMIKGLGKKRQRRKPDMKYVSPFFDEYMDGHAEVENITIRKPMGRGQWYTYYIPDKNCTVVLDHQFERAIRDKDIVDVIIAQRSEKIIVKLATGRKVALPVAPWDEKGALYRGEGWTKKEIEEYHHHGRETMGLARLFEAREAGVEEWEIALMKMASKRKTRHRAEHKPAFKEILNEVAENMDWEKFEEEAKEIVAEATEPVEDEPIPMKVYDMEMTKHVNEKLKEDEDALAMLPFLEDIPEITRFMQDGEFTDLASVSGAIISLPITGKDVFVAGQMVQADDGEYFMPGQTIDDEENETSEFKPGITCMMDGEPQLVQGLIMGDDPRHPMFLPGESTITESGELQFTETEEDRPYNPWDEPEPEPEPEVEEPELEEEQNSEEEAEEMKPPPPPPPKKEFIYVRPKRLQLNIDWGVKRREKAPKKPIISLDKEKAVADIKARPISEIEAVVFDMTLPTFEKDIPEQRKERIEKRTEKKSMEEYAIEKKKREIKEKAKKTMADLPKAEDYVPGAPVRKSEKLNEIEQQVKEGSYLTDYKKYMVPVEKTPRFNWKEAEEFAMLGKSVGLLRHKVWQKSGTIRKY